MFGLFNKKDNIPPCPVKEERRQWLENAFCWLTETFGEDNIRNRRILTPHHTDFPIKYNGDPQTARDTIDILARQMEIYPDEIELTIYSNGENELSTGSPFGGKIYLKQFDDEKYSGGLYFDKQEDGKYHIGLEKEKLLLPEFMVATLAHELSHIKLLGEGRITENDEPLTDLTTVVFGLGIFNANAAFATFRTINSSGWRKLGYLTQMEWGYGLALLAQLRNEKSPPWIAHLSKNVKSDFLKSEHFIAYMASERPHPRPEPGAPPPIPS
jgi:hypothetical protein